MSAWDWSLVVLLNGSVIVYGLYLSRGVRSSADWFLGGRRFPWWLVGLSMYGTAIDVSDLVADSGGTYEFGFSFFAVNWIGAPLGWLLAGFFIALPMYRAGMYTNAEYLEARYGPAVRVMSAFVQVQYRSSVLAILSASVLLTLQLVCGWGDAAWWAVAVVAILAAIYTALGGLRSVAVTDALQVVVMTAAALIIWVLVWDRVGGWSGMEEKLAQHDAHLPNEMLHAGQSVVTQRTPAWLMTVAFILMGVNYAVVNHTQSMRMFGAKSVWDFKMSVFVASGVLVVMTFFNLTMGIMGRALHPDQSLLPEGRQDYIYPLLVSEVAPVGLKGIVVAGILAAAFSTFDSIGSTLSSLLTRDVYARLFVRDRSDRHYLRMGQWLTPVIIGGSFLYIPFMKGGMLNFWIDISSVFVMPLLTVYLMGIFTRVHRSSGWVGLLVGTTYGILRLLTPLCAEKYGITLLPSFLMDPYGAYLYSMLITAGAMVVVSLFAGWGEKDQLFYEETDGWLRRSQLEVQRLQETEPDTQRPWLRLLPAFLAVLALAVGCFLYLVVFW